MYDLQVPFETLYRVALVRPNVSENISPPSSGFLGVIRFHSVITMETLFNNLSIEGNYLWLQQQLGHYISRQQARLWRYLCKRVSTPTSWGVSPCEPGGIREAISSETPILTRSTSRLLSQKTSLFKHVVFKEVTPCGSFKNRRFGWTKRLHHQDYKTRWTRNVSLN
jgi:hypothetical protein